MKDALTNEQLKEWAQHLYIRAEKNLKDISLDTGVSESQLRNWKEQYNWEAIKRTLPTTRDYQIEQLYKLLEKTTSRLSSIDDVNPKEVDLIVKYTAAIKNLDTEISLPQIVEVATLFTNWLKPRDLPLTKTIALQFDKFIKTRLSPTTI